MYDVVSVLMKQSLVRITPLGLILLHVWGVRRAKTTVAWCLAQNSRQRYPEPYFYYEFSILGCLGAAGAATFDGSFIIFSWAFLKYCSDRTKKLHNISFIHIFFYFLKNFVLVQNCLFLGLDVLLIMVS